MHEDPALTAGDYQAWRDGGVEVHEASGMVAVQLQVTVTDAFSWLRAYAAVTQRPLVDVARDIIASRLRPN